MSLKNKKEKKDPVKRDFTRLKTPHTYAIIFFAVVVCWILTFLIPAGKFSTHTIEYTDANGETATRTVLMADTFRYSYPLDTDFTAEALAEIRGDESLMEELEVDPEALDALLKHGGGMPAFFCDDVAVDMMLRAGVDLRDARNWAGMGCSEVRVPGKHGTGVTPVYVNVFKLLELAIYNGKNPNTGLTLCPSVRKFEDCRSVDDIIELFSEQLDYYLPFIPKIERAIAESYYTLTPTPFLSATVNYRIEMAKDISWGRGPNYNDTIVHAHGYPNTANALAALDEVLFKQKKYTLEQVKKAMEELI